MAYIDSLACEDCEECESDTYAYDEECQIGQTCQLVACKLKHPCNCGSFHDGKLLPWTDFHYTTKRLKGCNLMRAHSAKNNAKKQELTRKENEERIAKMPKSEPMLTQAKAAAKAVQIMESEYLGDQMNTRGCSLENSLGIFPRGGKPSAPRGQWSLYFGYTGRMLHDESMRWLTLRGASAQAEDGSFVDPTARNRPTLLWADGSTISMKEAQTLAGFIFFEVYSSTLMINARYVERALQKRYQHLPLGVRLWRHPDKGKKYDKEVDGKVHKVFITCSPRVAQMLSEREIKVNI